MSTALHGAHYPEQGKPQCSFTVVLTKGDFKTFIPVLCVGAKAEDVAEMLEGDDLVLLEGSLSWKAGKSKDAGKLQVVCFDVEQLTPANMGTATAPAMQSQN